LSWQSGNITEGIVHKYDPTSEEELKLPEIFFTDAVNQLLQQYQYSQKVR